MVDIQSSTAEIKRGKERRRKIETTGQKYNGLPYYIGRDNKRKSMLSISASIKLGERH